VNLAEDGDAGSDSAATSTYSLTSFIRYFLRFAGELLAPGKRFLKIWLPLWFPSSESPTAAEDNVGESTKSSEEENNAADATGDVQYFCFSRFDVLQSPLDHHYLETADEVLIFRLEN
jgi:hypothetical protein